jgi:nucleoside-diphosphate-sugar epimerase
MQLSTVYSEGIFHGLPTFPEHESKKYSAIVTGANGISGTHILRTLEMAPTRWEKIYALSRKPSSMKFDNRVTFISVDFLESPEKIASILRENNVSALVP